MKRIFVLLIAFVIAFALVGCNVAPNVPRVTPYATNGNYYGSVPNGAYDADNRGTYNSVPPGTVTNNNLPGGTGVNNNMDGSRAYTNGAGT